MRAIGALVGREEPQFVDWAEPPEPGPGEVLCATRQLGVCGTDREILLSRAPALPHGADFLVLGHECLAEILAVGPDVTGFRPGELVVPVVRRPFAEGKRRVDMRALGEFTERGILNEHGFSAPRWLDRPEFLVRVATSIADVAVFAEPVAVVEKGINEASILQTARLGSAAWPHDVPRVLVTGLGPIAFAAVLACRRREWPVTVYGRDEIDSSRAQLVRQLGAQYAPAEHWIEEPEDVEQSGYDLVLECTGSEAVMVRTAGALASCGIMVWLGSSRIPQPRELNLALVMRNGIIRNHVHLGTVNAAMRDFQDALTTLDWWTRHDRDALDRIFTSRVRLDAALWHYVHREPQGIKCVIEM